MNPRTVDVLHRGVESAILASIPQVLIPKLEERLFLRDRETADLGPRLIEALARRARRKLPEDTKWIGASAFHFGYAAFWGACYALAQERFRFKPWQGGVGLAALIHLITFPRWGAAVLMGTEKHPRDRPMRMEVVLATAPIVFGLGTALLYRNGPKERELRKPERGEQTDRRRRSRPERPFGRRRAGQARPPDRAARG